MYTVYFIFHTLYHLLYNYPVYVMYYKLNTTVTILAVRYIMHTIYTVY